MKHLSKNCGLFARFALVLLVISTFSSKINAVTVTWTGGAGNNLWDAPTNWDTGMVPTSGDDVVIVGVDVSITSPVNINSLTLSGSGVGIHSTNGSAIGLLGNLNWSDGAIHDIVINVFGGSCDFSGGTKFIFNCGFKTHGTINWGAGNISVQNAAWENDGTVNATSSAHILNPGNATIYNFADGGFEFSAGGFNNVQPVFHNSGLLKRTGTGQTYFQGNVTNNGQLDLGTTGTGGFFFQNITATFSAGTLVTGTGLIGFDNTSCALENANLDFGPPTVGVDIYNNSIIYGVGGNQATLSVGYLNWYDAVIGKPVTIKSGGTLMLRPITNGGTRTLLSTLTNNGTCNWLANNLGFFNGTFQNNYEFNVGFAAGQGFSMTNVGTSTANSFVNCGKFHNQEASTIQIGFSGCNMAPPYFTPELNGTGTVALSVAYNPGGVWMRPGNSPGELAINPSVTAGTVYDMEIFGSQADKLVSTGNINLANGLLRVSLDNAADGTYPIIQSTGGTVSGFSSMNALYSINGGAFSTTPPANLSFLVTANSVSVKLDPGSPPNRVCTFKTTGNWDQTANWIHGFIPNPLDTVVILAGKTATIVGGAPVVLNAKLELQGTIVCTDMTFGPDILLSYSGGGKIEIVGSTSYLEILAPAYTLNIPIFCNGGGISGPGVMTVNNGSLLFGTEIYNLEKAITIGAGATVELSNIYIRNSSPFINNGTFNLTGQLYLYQSASFTNNHIANFGVLLGGLPFGGDIFMDNGSLLVNNGTMSTKGFVTTGFSFPNTSSFTNTGTFTLDEMLGVPLTNSGVFNIPNPSSAAIIGGNITNQSAGTITVNRFATVADYVVINNAGTFKIEKTGGLSANLDLFGQFQNDGTFSGSGNISVQAGTFFSNNVDGKFLGTGICYVYNDGVLAHKNTAVNTLTREISNVSGIVNFFPNTIGNGPIFNNKRMNLSDGVLIERLLVSNRQIFVDEGTVDLDSVQLGSGIFNGNFVGSITDDVLPSNSLVNISKYFVLNKGVLNVDVDVAATAVFDIENGGGSINATLSSDAPLINCSMGCSATDVLHIYGAFINNGVLNLKMADVPMLPSGTCPSVQVKFDGPGDFLNTGTIQNDPDDYSPTVHFDVPTNNFDIGTIIAAPSFIYIDAGFTNAGEIDLNDGSLYLRNHDVFFESTTVLTPIVSNLGGDINFDNSSLELGCLVPLGNNNIWSFTNTDMLNNNGDFYNNRYVEIYDYFESYVPMTIETEGTLLLAASATELHFHQRLTNRGTAIWSGGTIHKYGTGFGGQIRNFGEFKCNNINSMIGESTGAVFVNCGDLKAIGTTDLDINMMECPDMGLTPKILGGGELVFNADYNLRSTISPGNSPGTLTINPNITAIPTMEFYMEIIDDQADLLVSDGVITLGGTLKIHFENTPIGEYPLMSGSSVAGSFASVLYQVGNGTFSATPPTGVTLEIDATSVGIAVAIALPVELLSFIGKKQGASNQLLWETATERNNLGFHVERSQNGLDWAEIGFVAGNGNTATPIHYQFLDKTPLPAANFYRLAQEDLNGSVQFSNIVHLSGNAAATSGLLIYPQPASHSFSVEFESLAEGQLRWSMFDMGGKQVRSGIFFPKKGANTLSVERDGLSGGSYRMVFFDENGEPILGSAVVLD